MGYTKAQREANAKKKAELANSIPDKKNTDEEKQVNKQDDITSVLEKKKKEVSVRNLPLSTEVLVANNCHNELNYISKNTGFRTTWDNFGNPIPMSLEELLIMRNSQRKFFERPWIRIVGFADSTYDEIFSVEDILNFLQVKQYYKNSLCPDNLDDLFKLPTDELEKRIPNISLGTKSNIVVRANDLIEKGQLDSLSVIMTLEKLLNCELSRPNI